LDQKCSIEIDQTAPTLDVNAGMTTVRITTIGGGCSRTRTITVVASDKALITNVEIEELTETNSIKIIVTGQGDYEYSLDEEFGFYQESNFYITFHLYMKFCKR
jgi:hypothetical protein